MKPRMMLKIGVDIVMTALLLCQMAYMLVGEAAHEWIGVAMFVLFILHHILNWQWYKSLARGKYGALRILQTAVDFLALLCMAGLMVSGIIMSREVFAFLPIEGGMGFARILHMLSAYWGFILISIHIGLHCGAVMGMLRKICGSEKPSHIRTWVLRVLALAVCGFGIYAFFKHSIADYLFLRSQFVFFDMEQPLILFFAEYISMMALWAVAAYYAARALRHRSSKKADIQNSKR